MSGVRVPLRPLHFARTLQLRTGVYLFTALEVRIEMRMICQPKLMLGVIALSLGALAPIRLLAQARTQEKLPDETPRALVVAFRSSEKGTGTNLGEQIRTKLQGDIPIKQMYVIPKATICANLEASGFPCDSMPDAITSRLLATSLRADFYVDGIVTKTATGYKADARLVLARDNSMLSLIHI